MKPCPSTYTTESNAAGRFFYECEKPEGHGHKYGKSHKKRKHGYQFPNGEWFTWTDEEEDDR